MKIKILNWTNPDLKSWKPEGRNGQPAPAWTRQTCYCNIQHEDGTVENGSEVFAQTTKTKQEVKDKFLSGEMLEVTKETKKTGQHYYKFSFSAGFDKGYKKGGGYSKPSYNVQEYDDLFRHAYKISTGIVDGLGDKVGSMYADVFTRLLSTYIISATNAGVKIPTNPQPQATQEVIMHVEKVANVMGGEVVDTTPPNQEPLTDDDLNNIAESTNLF